MINDSQSLGRLALGSYLSCLVYVPLWQLRLSPHDGYSLGFHLLMLLPLLLPLPGMLKGRPYTHAWSGFIACLYLVASLTQLWTAREQFWWPALATVLLLSWLLASSYYARHRGRELGLGLKKKN
ncbi:DUF2069 domain-containing protein [Ferrimonas sediminicola]|uniref:DUF2069 domain-containing protein n=1 Tax=Ferrimonas sediminicola TaxID=2569538 RepID=A0A4U1BD74_9GAMM|nr:DUF2069 domain-containing protein [Ferrimonas sediminicola]TKB49029.1 DUF2069 domain-containing protein [Ferrimonas sediminicola]